MKQRVAIKSMASISALGTESKEVWQSLNSNKHYFKLKDYDKFEAWVSELKPEQKQNLFKLREESHFKSLDPSVLMAIWVSRKAYEQSGWKDSNFGVNIGSSRGATGLFEKYYDAFKNESLGRAETLSSPTTTLGNISSWVGHDLQSKGPNISHSIACSTSLHAILNGIAWINSGMSQKFLAGGSEAALTAFSVAQMKALKIYSNETDAYPCKALDQNKRRNTMILGEGAAIFCLEPFNHQECLAVIEGVGYATEPLTHNISISSNADCFQESMKMALKDTNPNEIDAIVVHAPGTIKGDQSERNAITCVFGDNHPVLASNKWQIGHTLGASGALSIEMAVLMLQHNQLIPVPYLNQPTFDKDLKKILVNAVGFGGNAVSILLSLD